MKLGAFSISLAVKDIQASKPFMKSWALRFLAAILSKTG
jgi:hypothetical protein